MSSVKSRKVSLIVIRSIVALTGVLMLAFQNCSRINAIQVSDIAGKAIAANEFSGDSNNIPDDVSIQIEDDNGGIINVDHLGNQTVVDNSGNQASNNNSEGNNSDTGGSSGSDQGSGSGSDHGSDSGSDQGSGSGSDPVAEVDDEDSEDLDLCVAQLDDRQKYDDEGKVFGKPNKYSNRDTLAHSQKIKCKKKKDKDPSKRKRCMDLVRENGVTVLDVAQFADNSRITSTKGKTILISSNPELTATRSLTIDHAVGRTIVCGVAIARLDIKKGKLELREGANVKSCGEIKGNIYIDEESSIDGAEDSE